MYIVTSKMEIKRIRQLEREQGVDIAVQGLVCLPQDIRKYTGSIARVNRAGGHVLFLVRIKYNGFHSSVTFENEVDVEQYLHDTNVRENLPIKNKFTVFDDRVLVEISGGNTLVCNVVDLYYIELHKCWSLNGYIVTNFNGHNHFFHNLVMNGNNSGPYK